MEDSFAPHPQPPGEPTPASDVPSPVPPSPEARAVFGRPPSAAPDAPFQPAPGERLIARHTPPSPVPPSLTAAFGGSSADGFAPEPGTRLDPQGARAESPWWKQGAERDPWRDPHSPYWLGSGAMFVRGYATQLEPALDSESDLLDPHPPADGPAATDDDRRPVRRRFGLSALLLTLVTALVAGAVGGGVGYWVTHRADNALHRDNVSLGQTGTPANRPPGSVADLAARVGPAVVSISVSTSGSYGVGSGVVIDKDGDVLTNNHVIATATGSGARDATITVTFSDEATARARVVGADPVSDLAVIKVASTELTVAALGDSSKLAVGDPVVAIGSPLGLAGTVTSGIVSALNRAVHVYSEDGSSDAYLNAIQTDAAINPGNSGGALVDASGAVVGINSAGRFTAPSGGGGEDTPVSGIGYAIPIDYARDVATELIESGKASHGSLGVQGRTVTDAGRQGAYLAQVDPDGAAAKAGLRAGDVVTVADGVRITNWDDLAVRVQLAKPGDTINLTYQRGSSSRTVTATLGSA